MNNKLKIAEICPFSAGVCGVWSRVLSESLEFKKLGFDVNVFSSNLEKGSNQVAACEEETFGIKIARFESKSSKISNNVNIFDFETSLVKYNPDVIITHLLHPHSFKALEIARRLNKEIILVTHAPFNVKRKFPLNLATWFFNNFVIRSKLRKFSKIVAITKWEIPYLERLGLKKEKIYYIPNGLPKEFFINSKIKPTKDVLFLGRIAPVKNLEVLIYAAKLLPKVKFSIVGSAEKEYLDYLQGIVSMEKISNVKFYPPVYDLKDKITLIDQHKLFVLPSKREAMPIVLLEALARGKIVISSNTDGGKEIIRNGKNGFIFNFENFEELSELITNNLKPSKKIQANAKDYSKLFDWRKLIKSYLSIL
jgi:glycosyltransferase involved in cell wall biosynthesis